MPVEPDHYPQDLLPFHCTSKNPQVPGKRHRSVSAFIDSGADTELICHQFVLSVGIELLQSSKSHKVLALDGHSLYDSNLETTPVTLLLGGNPRDLKVYRN